MTQKVVNIFLIEDNPGDIRLFREVLSESTEWEFRLSVAKNLTDAKANFSAADTDIIVCDLGLPESSGLDTLLEVKQLNEHLPVVILTSNNDPELGRKAVKFGAQDYLIKDELNSYLLEKALIYSIERKNLLEEMQEKEERFRRIFEDSTLGKYQTTVEGQIIEINRAYARMFGYDDVDELKKSIKNSTHAIWHNPSERDRLISGLSKAGQQYHHGEYKLRRSDGTWFFGFVHVRKVDYKHKPGFFLEGYIDDITDRVKAEEELKKHLSFLQDLIDNIPNPVYFKDKNLRFTGCNKAFADHLGLSQKDIIGKTTADIAPAELARQYAIADKKLLQEQQRQVLEGKVPYADQSLHDVIFYKNVVLDKNDNVTGIIGLMLDITEKKEAIEKLRIESELNKGMAELSKQLLQPGISISEVSQKVLEYGKQITGAEHGYAGTIDPENDDLIVHTFTEMIRDSCSVNKNGIRFPKQENAYQKLWGHSLNTQEAFYTNDPQSHPQSGGFPDGHLRLKNFLSVPAIVNGELVGQVAFANSPNGFNDDILEKAVKLTSSFGLAILKHKFTEELIEAKKRAEAHDKLKSAFLANMSHEIRTPLNAIVGFSQMIGEEGIPYDEMDGYKEAIVSNSDLLLKLINDIIEMAMIDAGEVELKMQKHYISNLAHHVYSEWRSRDEYYLKENQVGFHLITSEDLSDKWISTDSLRFNQIMSKLLENAFRYTQKGRIEIGYRMFGKDAVEFFVKDTGPGIPPEHLSTIFDRFRQVDELTVRPFPGTGLGLAITKKLVEMMNGRIEVESTIGAGTRFRVFFPLSGTAELPQPVQRKQPDNWSALKVLVVEDIDSNLELLEAILSSRKAKMIPAVTGMEAIDKLKQNPDINLILMDIKLPEMDGYQAIREIRKFNHTTPIIVQTAFSDDEARKKAFEAGCNDFLTKPITRRLLAKSVEKILK
ncbi:MAG: response regulator [Bacteroidales bacterium]